MKIIYHVSLIIAAVTLTACAGTPNTDVVQKPEMMNKCVPESAAALARTTLSSEADIKSKTNAKVVRLVAPGQPITKDYHPGRVTVIADPQTKTILKAFCG
ncbi:MULTISPECIES: I78 family peptidase inhibitor [Acinetobacter]|uniref:Hemolysin n=3 Tax=Acinetobacter TaxID=469 RepID=A0AB35M351_9GAMM|nr:MULTISPECIES: I78 family peptidase inhibitor [Acinetobacter]MCO8109668.1 I78 family peptidase inhibitor [Acinetobacter indicus]MDM1720113.1 hemolysin [Acinetobacter towneri]MDM1722756.1 hemolysin [Acinetobacter towneri]MDM1732213.1 hemolysin [Acinetobacter towneri]MDM1734935.1 hemolysin [Acinetobacter towneri]